MSQASLYHVICCNLSHDNLAKKENVMSLTGHRSKVMKKQAKYGQNGKIHISTNSPYFGLQDKPSSRAIKNNNNKTKN